MAVNPAHTTLALGCDDGAVRLVSLLDGELEHVRKFDAVKTRLLSLAWGPPVAVPRSSPADAKGKGKARMDVDGEAESESEDEAESSRVEYEDATLVTGCADSTVRIWDARSGRCLYRMTTDKIKGEHTLVWSVAFLASGTIVSGDSMGLVKFWDSKMGVQSQSLKVSEADVLALAVGPDGNTVYASGVDQKIHQLQFMAVTTGGGAGAAQGKGKKAAAHQQQKQLQDRSHWVVAHSRRMHSHDVRTLAVSPQYSITSSPSASGASNQVPVVISGGLDFSLVYTPASTSISGSEFPSNPISDSQSTLFSESYHRKSPYIPQRSSPACFAPEAGLIASRSEAGISIWSLGSSANDEKGYTRQLDMELSSKTSWLSSAISANGEWLAISDLVEVKVFRLRWSSSDGSLSAKRAHGVSAALAGSAQLQGDLGAAHLHFTADGSRLVMATAAGARVVVLALPEKGEEQASVLRVFNQHREGKKQASGRSIAGRKPKTAAATPAGAAKTDGSESESESEPKQPVPKTQGKPAEREERISSIVCLASSVDGQWLVTSDTARRMHVFNLDSLQHHDVLPSLPLAAASLVFSPGHPSILTVGLPNNTVQFFDVDSQRVPSWARRISANPSGALTSLRDPMMGMVYDPLPADGVDETLLLYGATWLCKMKIPSGSPDYQNAGKKGKRKADSEQEMESQGQTYQHVKSTPAEVFHKYQPILLVDFNAKGEMVVIERPYFNLLGQMAPAFVEQKYGTS